MKFSPLRSEEVLFEEVRFFEKSEHYCISSLLNSRMHHKNFSVSIVSHGHKQFIASLLDDLVHLNRADFEVVLTLNLPEELDIDYGALPFPLKLIRNSFPQGFAKNHNAAFAVSHGEYFVILNPDIRLIGDPFDPLLLQLRRTANSIVAPMIVNGAGMPEDSARYFPTPFFLIRKALHKIFNIRPARDFSIVENDVSTPDWVAGMFIAVPRSVYAALHGLDERYRMYYEDVDFCARARLAGYKVMVNGHVKVIHEAQRESHRNPRYLAWHLSSALRFFTSKVFLKIQLYRLLRTLRSP